jgi:integrase/recombinase XerD
VSVKVPNKALEIIELYKPEKKDFNPDNYIFPFFSNEIEYTPVSLFQAISSRTANINSDLKDIAKLTKINKNLSFHSSRHTWATRALRKGMRIEYVSKLMGHSSIKTTQIYAKIVNSELDKAMDVFND